MPVRMFGWRVALRSGKVLGHAEMLLGLLFLLAALDFFRIIILADDVFHGERSAIDSYAGATGIAKAPATEAEARAEATRCDLWLRHGPGHGKGGDVATQQPVPHGYKSTADPRILDWTKLPTSGYDMVAYALDTADSGALWWMNLHELATVVIAKDRCLHKLLGKHGWSAVRVCACVCVEGWMAS